MFTYRPRWGPHPRPAARKPAARLHRITAATAAVICGGAPRVWWRLDSPQMLLSGWVVVFHGTAAWRNHDLIIFPLCFIEHLSSCAVQLPRLVAGCARQAAPGGLGISSSGTAHCAAGSPGWSGVTLQRHRLRRRRRP